MRWNYAIHRSTLPSGLRYSHGTASKKTLKDLPAVAATPNIPVPPQKLPNKPLSRSTGVDLKKLVITGISIYKNRDDIVRYAWSLTQNYPKSVEPSSDHENGWIAEFDGDTGERLFSVDLISTKNLIIQSFFSLSFFYFLRY